MSKNMTAVGDQAPELEIDIHVIGLSSKSLTEEFKITAKVEDGADSEAKRQKLIDDLRGISQSILGGAIKEITSIFDQVFKRVDANLNWVNLMLIVGDSEISRDLLRQIPSEENGNKYYVSDKIDTKLLNQLDVSDPYSIPRTQMLENNRKIVSKKIDFLRQYAIYDGEDKNSQAFAVKQQEAYDFYSALFDIPENKENRFEKPKFTTVEVLDKDYSKASKALSEIINDFTSCVIDNSKVRRNAFDMSELELSK